MTEREWQSEVLNAARTLGWTAYHTHDSRRSEPGFPDLVLVRDRLIMAELKTDTGKPSTDQLRWLRLLERAGVEVYLWQPKDRDGVLNALRRRTVAAT